MRDKDGCVVALLTTPVVLLVSSIANGFILSVLWGWFVFPFFDVPSLNIPQAIGLSMVVRFLTKDRSDNDKKEEKSLTKMIIDHILLVVVETVIAIAIAYIVKLFV